MTEEQLIPQEQVNAFIAALRDLSQRIVMQRLFIHVPEPEYDPLEGLDRDEVEDQLGAEGWEL